VIAATGRKTVAGFAKDINDSPGPEKLQVSEQGTLVVNKQTFQSGVKSLFAAGDAVGGAGNIIRSIAQARTAAEACHRYLSGEAVKPAKPEPKEFLSKKNNLKAGRGL
jgi:NADPH-dependent glutamate synthase beta subunit-like oxidoreductase